MECVYLGRIISHVYSHLNNNSPELGEENCIVAPDVQIQSDRSPPREELTFVERIAGVIRPCLYRVCVSLFFVISHPKCREVNATRDNWYNWC